MKEWTAVIPLRAGSKGLAKKNVCLLGGKPLYMHSVDVALEAGATHIVITTDIDELFSIKFDDRVVVIRRPAELCHDAVPMAPVILHAISYAKISGVILLLQATSPLRTATDVQDALDIISSGKFDVVMSVTSADPSVLKWGRVNPDGSYLPISNVEYCFSNRQSLGEVYKPTGAIYAMNSEWFSTNGGFLTEKIGVVKIPNYRSIDIDSMADLQLCENFLNSTSKDCGHENC